jgi:alpha-galactosidase
MQKMINRFVVFICLLVAGSCANRSSTIWLDDVNLESVSASIRSEKAKTNYLKKRMTIAGVSYERGIGAITTSVLAFSVNGDAQRFKAQVGADDEGRKDEPVKFYVVGDRKILFESGEMKAGDPAENVDVSLAGIRRVGLLVTDHIGGLKNNRTYCNWANAHFIMTADSLPHPIPNPDEKYILTPQPPPTPRINSPAVFGARPGNPILYTIAATGQRPMHFSAEPLPSGITLDPRTGIITGKISAKGTFALILKAQNSLGETRRPLTINIGDAIALTPPMGWNGWNSWASEIDQAKVIASAEAMVNTGLINHGWSYINIDDTWQGVRGGPLMALQPNQKFPDIKGMVERIHALGLKAGIYSTPYIYSYAGYVGASSDYEKGGETAEPVKEKRRNTTLIGKFRFESNDARQMAEWGFDYLKYDWRIDVNSTERMSTALQKSGRDIVFSISNNAPFEKAADWMRLTNLWRTGPDISDSWNSLYHLTFTLDKWAEFAGPGHWNDPDMMILGNVTVGDEMHPTRLSADEQYTHVSIYSLLSAPMLIGCPLEQLDPFTLNLLTNDEVIEINQDPLGKPARFVTEKDGVQIWLKPLLDGSLAVGLCNTDGFAQTPQSYFRWGDEKAKSFGFEFNQTGLSGTWKVRDVWRQKDLGEFSESFNTTIPFHGVALLRMSR